MVIITILVTSTIIDIITIIIDVIINIIHHHRTHPFKFETIVGHIYYLFTLTHGMEETAEDRNNTIPHRNCFFSINYLLPLGQLQIC